MGDSDWAMQACHHIKKVMFIFCRYPVFTAQYIRDHIDRPHTDPKELQDYKDNLVTRGNLRSLLLVTIYVSYTLKNVYVLYAWMGSFNYEDYLQNLQPLGYEQPQLLQMGYSLPAHTLKHISCLYTNCTRLGPAQRERLGERDDSSTREFLADVAKLPMLDLCQPLLERLYYTPLTKLGALGILVFLVTMYTHLLLGSWTTIQQTLLPASNDLIMTITSPKVTQKVMRLRSCELLRDLALSLRNYRLFAARSHTNNNVLAPAHLILTVSDRSHTISASAESGAQSNKLAECRYAPRWPPCRFGSMLPDECSMRKKRGSDSSGKDPLVDSILRDLYFTDGSERDIGRVVDNCMPLVYTEWWRPHLARILTFVMIEVLGGCLFMCIGFLFFWAWRVSIHEALVREFKGQMRRANCFFWHETANSFAVEQALSMDQISYSWSVFSILDAIALNLTAGVTGLMMYGNYWALVMHLSLWLAEVRMFMVASLLATRFQHERDRQQVERNFRHRHQEVRREDTLTNLIGRHHLISTRQFYNMTNLRQQFKDTTRIHYIYAYKRIQRRDKWTYNFSSYVGPQSSRPAVYDYHRLNSKHSDRSYAERFLAEILFPLPANIRRPDRSGQLLDKIDYDVETMEQIYVNFRLLVGYVRGLNPAIRLFMIIAYLLNYGYILLSIICQRKFAEHNNETIILCVLAFAFTSYVILLSADFHANARQLQPLLWSLIAQLTYSKNLRIQHLRTLLIKQTVDLDGEGGLALTVNGIPITYVFIIQLIIWTATIFVLALKPHTQET